jgi:hypothetical protein
MYLVPEIMHCGRGKAGELVNRFRQMKIFKHETASKRVRG